MRHGWEKVKDVEAGVQWRCRRCGMSVFFTRKGGPPMDGGITYTAGGDVYASAADGSGLDRVEGEVRRRNLDCDTSAVRRVMDS